MMNESIPRLSFVAAVDLSNKARFLYVSDSVYELLGYEPRELIGTPAVDLNHPEESPEVVELHCEIVRRDKAATVAYIRLKHKDSSIGYVTCVTTRTVAQNVLIGSVSPAFMGPQAMHHASTAQEVRIITPGAQIFDIQRWSKTPQSADRPASRFNTPPPSYFGLGIELSITSGMPQLSSTSPALLAAPSPIKSTRMAVILNRFSLDCPILYCFNNPFIRVGTLAGISFFDFVSEQDEALVRSLVMRVKQWGVNDLGQPSDGGFGFGQFHLCLQRRNSETASRVRLGRRRRIRHSAVAPSTSRSVGVNVSKSQIPMNQDSQEILVDALFSPYSDGLMVVLRRAS